MARYVLSAPFWDGTQLHPAGAVVELEVAPSTAEALDPKPKRAKAAPKADEPEGDKAEGEGAELA